jgi:pentatricopeptide repeat protein
MTVPGYEEIGEQRYVALRRKHSKYKVSYLNEARTLHTLAWQEVSPGNYILRTPTFLTKAKLLVDSAKTAMPKSVEPYLVWARLQAPFKHYTISQNVGTIDEELALAKERFPKDTIYLDIARYYEEVLAKRDKNYLLDAAVYLQKASEYNELKAAHYNNFAIMVWRYYKSFGIKDYGLKIALKGLEKFPKHAPLYRAKLWNEARYEHWEEALETIQTFEKYAKKLEPSYFDYKYIGMAYEKAKRYEEAIEAYNTEISMINEDVGERALAQQSLINCYSKLGQYDEAIRAFYDYRGSKKSMGKKIEYYDYNKLITIFQILANDSNMTMNQRLMYLEKSDSMLAASAIASPEYEAQINERRLEFVAMQKLKLQYGTFGGEQAALPEFLEAANRLSNSIEKKSLRSDNEQYLLMKGYHWALIHYLFTDDSDNQYLTAAKMLATDIPEEVDLAMLTEEKKTQYREWKEEARQIYDAYHPRMSQKASE